MRYTAENSAYVSTILASTVLLLHTVHTGQVPLQVAGTINQDFNAAGVMITSTGLTVTGPDFFSGSLVIDAGDGEGVPAIAINQIIRVMAKLLP